MTECPMSGYHGKRITRVDGENACAGCHMANGHHWKCSEIRADELRKVCEWLRGLLPHNNKSVFDELADALERNEHQSAR